MNNINKVVKELNEVKNDLKVAKSKEKSLVEQVKGYMGGIGLETLSLDEIGIKVSCKEVVKTEINEDALIQIITKMISNTSDEDLKDLLKECLVVKTVIDEDKVQELIYKGFISVDDIQPAVIEKVSTRLTLKEVK